MKQLFFREGYNIIQIFQSTAKLLMFINTIKKKQPLTFCEYVPTFQQYASSDILQAHNGSTSIPLMRGLNCTAEHAIL